MNDENPELAALLHSLELPPDTVVSREVLHDALHRQYVRNQETAKRLAVLDERDKFYREIRSGIDAARCRH